MDMIKQWYHNPKFQTMISYSIWELWYHTNNHSRISFAKLWYHIPYQSYDIMVWYWLEYKVWYHKFYHDDQNLTSLWWPEPSNPPNLSETSDGVFKISPVAATGYTDAGRLPGPKRNNSFGPSATISHEIWTKHDFMHCFPFWRQSLYFQKIFYIL
jgi:hypothetical protein